MTVDAGICWTAAVEHIFRNGPVWGMTTATGDITLFNRVSGGKIKFSFEVLMAAGADFYFTFGRYDSVSRFVHAVTAATGKVSLAMGTAVPVHLAGIVMAGLTAAISCFARGVAREHDIRRVS